MLLREIKRGVATGLGMLGGGLKRMTVGVQWTESMMGRERSGER
jgi:hypothetical protein